MAARPLLFCKVVESGIKQFNDAAQQTLFQDVKLAQNNVASSSIKETWPEIRDPFILEDLQEEAIRAT